MPDCSYAEIIIDISAEKLDHTFTYRIPEGMKVAPGDCVIVPFGRSGKQLEGFVIQVCGETSLDPARIKEIAGFAPKKKSVQAIQLQLAAWMRQRYGSTMISALKMVLPVRENTRKRGSDDAATVSLVQPPQNITLSAEQQHIIDEIGAGIGNGRPDTFLIHGITGSGKTEVYMGLIDRARSRGYQSIVLIPEIALTYQTVSRFVTRFGDRVSVLHSKLSAGEKSRQVLRAERGEADIIVGPRSALFTPCSKLGLIIIDEEHEGSYKSEQSPKYHAREVAAKLAQLTGAKLVLGSATPSLEAYLGARSGRIRLFELTRRLTGGQLPATHVVDLRQELAAGNRSIFSVKLQKLLAGGLERGEQSVLFINRRGLAGFVSCRSCGYVIKCPHCDISLTQHRGGRLVCHYCGHTEAMPKLCPECESKYIMGFKAGTQQVEDAVKKLLPAARVLRMDADTTRKKGSYEAILRAFAGHEADILIGTQMIVKGHDFPLVTLVGILAADISLHEGDFRASEKTFQLLTQAAGRAGRAERHGEVVIQTYQPEHPAIVYAAGQDYKGFYAEETEFRELMHYPPYGHMLAVVISSEDGEECRDTARSLADMAGALARAATGEGNLVIGPAECRIGRIKDTYRQVFYIKNTKLSVLSSVRDRLEAYAEDNRLLDRVMFDLDPVGTY